MNILLMKYPLIGTFFLLSFLAVPAAEVIYHPPEPPPANPATFASAREDWLIGVQGKFTKYGNKPADIVFDGDSITNRWETTGKDMWTRFAGRAADFGIEGDRTENLLWRLQKGQVDGIDPKIVVLMIGTNNASRNTAEQISEGIKNIVTAYKKRCSHAHIVLMGIFPRGHTIDDEGRKKVAAVNEIIKSLDDGNRVSYVDIGPKLLQPDGTLSIEMAPDYLHPAAQGYTIWADAIQPFIDKYAPKSP